MPSAPFVYRSPRLIDRTWGVARQDNLLIVRFEGHLKEKHGRDSIAEALRLVGREPFTIIGDLFRLDRYDGQARVAWQEGMLPVKKNIQSIHIGTSNRMVSMGVTVFGLFLGMSIRNHRSPDSLLSGAASSHRSPSLWPKARDSI